MRAKNKNQGQGSRHEIEDDQQRRRGLHRACGSVYLLRRGVERAVKHAILAGRAARRRKVESGAQTQGVFPS